MRHRPLTLRRLLVRNLAVAVLAVICAALLAIPAASNTHRAGDDLNILIPTGAPAPAAGSAEALIAGHHCWIYAPPADMGARIPGHVVAEVNDRPVYGGPALVHDALEHKPGVTVRGWCK